MRVGAGDRAAGRFLGSLPFAMMAVIAVTDVLAGPGAGFLPLLSLGPAFASLSSSARRTAWIGLAALALCLALAVYDELIGSRQNFLTLLSIGGVTGAAMLASASREGKERELHDIRTVAEVAQRVLLRPVPRRVGPIHAAVSYTSAAARARIGGDLYEVVTTPGGVRIIVGDVQGKGLDAVETAAVVLAAFREAAFDEPDLPSVVLRLEKALGRQLTGEQFVTAVLVEIASERAKARLLNCGHPPPLLLRADGHAEFADPPDVAPPLGLASMTPVQASPYEIEFGPGDRMLLYTDGVIEARDDRGAFYPLADRSDLLRAHDPQEALDALPHDLVRYVGGPIDDDAAMLLLRRRQ
ncbi:MULTISPECIES: PP2C family protein-serine/threonine phosphatase [Actinomadura]|uniref:PP2C family protein-serine/threonine phosphatase n=2 Tax=Actinomadura yumaensis TaxID=111807 RepID=A0ABW2CKR4_9ACTN|nr:PP2C family protein-serine/threonine phosphatase [Actinomadura sp. J1-007]MWK38578.1 SpoIIE family protein phosphatase [Actinomadura sp. J1-007]